MAIPLAKPLSKPQYHYLPIATAARQIAKSLCLWHLSSLDAPSVAVVWALAFASIARVHLQIWVLLLVALGTWTVYVGDRLLDSRRAIRAHELDTLRERHFFHWRYRSILLPLAFCSAAAVAILIVQRMPTVIRHRNSVLAAAALMYFSGVHSSARIPRWLRRMASKELLVGVLFTAGCLSPAVWGMRSPGNSVLLAWPLLLCGIYFAALAWCNCSAIECWESNHRRWNADFTAGSLAIAGSAIALALSFGHLQAAQLVLAGALSCFLLLMLDGWRMRVSALTLRALADVVLLTPVLLLVLGARHR